MRVSEIFKSIQGESSWQGYPCIFVRLSGCNLRCRWCDTKYAYENGKEMPVAEIINIVKSEIRNPKSEVGLVEITGGEPLLQEEVYELSKKLLDKGYKVLVDTNGSIPADRLDSRIIRLIDIKCPGSGMSDKMYWANLKNLRPTDEIKFVLSDKRDYNWAKGVIKKYNLVGKAKVLLSPVVGADLSVCPKTEGEHTGSPLPKLIAEWMLKDNLPIRLNLQLHKYIGMR